MFAPSISELLVILLIVLVIFGANRLPQLGSDLSKAIKNFKHGLAGEEKVEGQGEAPKKIESAGVQDIPQGTAQNNTQHQPQDRPQA